MTSDLLPSHAARIGSYAALVRSDLDNGTALRRDLYISDELFVDEVEFLFGRSWHYVGHVSEFRESGSYRTVDLGTGLSVVIVRDDEGHLHALHNVCRHRGTRVVEPGCGTLRALVCPYHQWTYRLDGTLRKAPHMPADFDSSPYPLARAHLEVWQGMVFVNMSADEPPPLARLMSYGDLQLAGYGLAACRVAATVRYDVAANWKLVWENSQECYHCSANHPEFIKTFDLRRFYQDQDWLDRQVDYSADHRVAQTRFELKPGATSLTMSGTPACRLPLGTGTQAETFAVHLKPTFAVIACPDHVAVMTVRPAGKDRTQIDMHWFVRADAVDGEDYERDDLIRVWDATNRQDWALCELAQQGVLSPYYRPGPLAPEEDAVRAFYACYATLLEEAR